MKRTLGSVLALSLLMSGVAAAAGRDDDRRGDYDGDRYGYYDRGHDRDDDRDDRRWERDRRGDYRHDGDYYRDGHRHDNGRHLGHYKNKHKHRHPRYVAYRRGEYVRPDYRGYYVRDYRDYGLYAPPRNYEWRRMDDRYVLVSIATGIISAVILNSL